MQVIIIFNISHSAAAAHRPPVPAQTFAMWMWPGPVRPLFIGIVLVRSVQNEH